MSKAKTIYCYGVILFLLIVGLPHHLEAQKRIPLPKTDSINMGLDTVPLHVAIKNEFSRIDTFYKAIRPAKVKPIQFVKFSKKEGKIRELKNTLPKMIAIQLMLGLLLMGFVIFYSPGYVLFLFSLLLSRKNLNSFYEDQKFGFGVLNSFLDFIFILSLSLGASLFSEEHKDSNLIWYPIFAAGFYYIRIVFIQVFGYLFTRNDTTIEHLFLWLVWARSLSVTLFLLFFIGYLQPFFQKEIIGLAILSLFFVLSVFWLFRLLRAKQYQTVWEATYFFLYLCTVELTPVLIISRDFIQ